MRNAHGT